MNQSISRRDFLKLAGAGATTSAVLTGCGPASRFVLREPYTNMPEYTYNGTSIYFATTCRECSAGCGLVDGLATTMGTVFSSIYTVDIPGSLNTVIFATKQKTVPENFAANFVSLSNDPSTNPLLIPTMLVTFPNLKTGDEPAQIFTDDHAPIEWIVNDMVMRFILGGGTEYLQ